MERKRVVVDPPQAGEVRVRMVASVVCHSCMHAADGTHSGLPMPLILGDEGAGVIEAVGPGGTLSVGDRVVISWAPGCGACRWCTAGRPGLCLAPAPFGGMADGTTRFHADGERIH